MPVLETELGRLVDKYFDLALEGAFDCPPCDYTGDARMEIKEMIKNGGSDIVEPFFEHLDYDFIECLKGIKDAEEHISEPWYSSLKYTKKGRGNGRGPALVQMNEFTDWFERTNGYALDDNSRFEELCWLIKMLEKAHSSN